MTVAFTLQIAKISAFIGAAFLCVAVGVSALVVGFSAHSIATQLNQQLTKVGHTQQLLEEDLVRMRDLITHMDMAADDARKVSRKESVMLDSANLHVVSILGHADESVVALTRNQNELTLHSVQTIDAGTQAVSHLQGVFDQSKTLLTASQGSLSDLDKVINDPAIPATLKSVAVASDATAGGMQHVQHMTSDADVALHNYLNPSWKTKVANWTLKIAHAVGGWF
jgi:hypothetical protein